MSRPTLFSGVSHAFGFNVLRLAASSGVAPEDKLSIDPTRLLRGRQLRVGIGLSS